jgi:HEAT repeat protein
LPDAELPVPEDEVPKEDPVVVEERRKGRVKEFISLLQDDNLHYRWKAAEALGEDGDNSAVEPLLKALNDPYVEVQWLAAKSLGKIGDIRALEPLIAALKAEDKWLRQGAAWADSGIHGQLNRSLYFLTI